MDVSSEIVHGLLPAFLVSVLGASYSMVGVIEGAGEAASLFVKVFSGALSDRWGRRKPLVFLGYAMGALSKPLFALAASPLMVLGARLFDRTGKGIRGAPRDALIADVTPAGLRGGAFGLRQALDTVGASVGPLLAILLMALSGGSYRFVFWVAVIPGLLAVAVLVLGVKEPPPESRRDERLLVSRAVREFGAAFWLVTALGAVFQLARFSEAFLILRAQSSGLSLALAPLVLVAMNVVYSLSAYPIGRLSDRIRREWLIFSGFSALAIADVVLATADDVTQVFLGVALWGIHLGLTQGILAALVADTCPSAYRGTAFGIFNLLSAVALFLASAIAGILWDRFGPPFTFLASAGLAIFGMAGLLFARPLWSGAAARAR